MELRRHTPSIIILIGLTLTAAMIITCLLIADKQEQNRFQSRNQTIKNAIEDRANTYIAMLHAGVGMFTALSSVDKAQFTAFVNELKLNEKYPGIQGLGYAVRVAPSEKDQLIARMQSQGLPNFRIWPDAPRDEYFVIIYLEPHNERNQAAIGYDMFSDPVRKEAMIKARDTGLTTVSQKVTLIQELHDPKQPGFLIYQPFYEQNVLKGFVYAPFRAYDFLTGVLDTTNIPGVDFIVYDGSSTQQDALLFKSVGQDEKVLSDPSRKQVLKLTIGGQDWTLYFYTNEKFEPSILRMIVPYIAIIGIIVSILLYSLSRSQKNAYMYAEKTLRDVRAYQSALKESEQRFRKLVESNIIGIIITDFNGNILEANDAFLDTVGYTAKDVKQKNLNWLHITPLQYRHLDEKALRYIRKYGAHTPFEKEYTRKDGSRVPVLVGMIYIGKKPELALKFILNLTEQKRLEHQKDEFISIASHELKTPITSIKAFAQILERRFKNIQDRQSQMYLNRMNKQIDRLTRLVLELLDVTKIQAGKIALRKEVFDLSKLISEVITDVSPTTEKHAIIRQGRESIYVYADYDRISQVLLNLLSNAIKYSPDAKDIMLNTTQNGANVTVSVKDLGPGIPKNDQKKIFDRFYQVKKTRPQHDPSLGLGLYISQEIISRHKGRIWVESAEGKGATFSFSLPIHKPKKK